MNKKVRSGLVAFGGLVVSGLGAMMLEIASYWIYEGIKNSEMPTYKKINTSGVGLGGALLFFIPIYLYCCRNKLVSQPDYRNRRLKVFIPLAFCSSLFMFLCGEDSREHGEKKYNYEVIMMGNAVLLAFLLAGLMTLCCFKEKAVSLQAASANGDDGLTRALMADADNRDNLSARHDLEAGKVSSEAPVVSSAPTRRPTTPDPFASGASRNSVASNDVAGGVSAIAQSAPVGGRTALNTPPPSGSIFGNQSPPPGHMRAVSPLSPGLSPAGSDSD